MWEYVSIAVAGLGFVLSLAVMLVELRVRIGALSGHLVHPSGELKAALLGRSPRR